MGQLIKFYIPADFTHPQQIWLPEEERGKVLEFRSPATEQPS